MIKLISECILISFKIIKLEISISNLQFKRVDLSSEFINIPECILMSISKVIVSNSLKISNKVPFIRIRVDTCDQDFYIVPREGRAAANFAWEDRSLLWDEKLWVIFGQIRPLMENNSKRHGTSSCSCWFSNKKNKFIW